MFFQLLIGSTLAMTCSAGSCDFEAHANSLTAECAMAVVKQDDLKILLDRAEAYAQSGELVIAMSCVEQALAIDPMCIRAHFAKAYIDYNSDNSAAAMADYNKLISIAPNNATALMHRGCLYYELGHGEEARNDFNAVLALSPNANDTESRSAIVLLQQIQLLPVLKDYRASVSASAAHEKF